MTHKTQGIVLRTIKYSETSLIVSVFTEKFGVQSYIVNGVRNSKKGSNKAALFQPGALLQLEVYHNELKNLQRIREASWRVLYSRIFSDVIRNSVSVFMIELLQRSLKQPEPNADLFDFCTDIFEQLDTVDHPVVVSNLPLFFALHLPYFFGFRIEPVSDAENKFLDMVNGVFSNEMPAHKHFLSETDSAVAAEILKVIQIRDLQDIQLHSSVRSKLLQQMIVYYNYHIQDFGQLKSLPVLQQVLQ
jgi:DNA repair protein RecO (recombination protein O)